MFIKDFLDTTLLNGALVAAGASGLYHNCGLLMVDYTVLERAEREMNLDDILLLYTARPAGMEMRTYLKEKIEQQAAGMLFLSRTAEEAELDKDTLRYCDQAGFPLILLPTKLSTKVLLQQSMQYLSFHSSHALERSAALRKVCLQDGNYMVGDGGAQLNYDSKLYYCALIFQLCGKEKESSFENQTTLCQVQNLLLSMLDPPCRDYIGFFDLTRQVCFISFSPKTRWSAEQKRIKAAFQKAQEHAPVPFRIGVGTPVSCLEQLRESFCAAETAIELGGRINKMPRVCLFEAAFPYKLILSSPESELRQYLQIYLGPILDSPEYLETIYNYYGNNMNIKETAAEMGIHVNTLRSRLKTISMLLDMDLKAAEIGTNLKLALIIRHYFNQQRPNR